MRKKDEMELQISYKAMRITWFITLITLFIIGFIQLYSTGERNIFLVIASLSVVINILIERYYLSKMNDDNYFIKYIAFVCILILLMLLVLWLVA